MVFINLLKSSQVVYLLHHVSGIFEPFLRDEILGQKEEVGFVLNVNKCTAASAEKLSEVIARAIILVDCHGIGLIGRVLSEEERSRVDIGAIELYFELCKEEFVRGNAEERARNDARDFVFPEGDLIYDGKSLRQLGTIEAVVRDRQLRRKEERYNSDRYGKYLAGISDAIVLSRVAEFGAAIPVASDFFFLLS